MKRRIAKLRAEEQDSGAALAGAIAIMAIGMIVSALLLSSIVNAMSFTSTVRAGVQSQASADAGIAAAQVSLLRGSCAADSTGGLFTGTNPDYKVQVQYKQTNGTFTDGCPAGTSADVRIASVGTAVDSSVLASRGDESTVEATFASASTPAVTTPPSGPAIFAYSGNGFSAGASLVSVDGSEPSVMIKTGNTACSGGSTGGVDWVVEGGSLTMSGGCRVDGNVWATGSVINGSGTATGIGGNVVAAAYESTSSSKVGGGIWATGAAKIGGNSQVAGNVVAGSVTITNGQIAGNVWSRGALTVSGGGREIFGNAEAASLSLTSSGRIRGNALVYGATGVTSATIQGSLKTKTYTPGNGAVVSGGVSLVPGGPTPGPAPVTAPPAPVVPKWLDFTYKVADWPGYNQVVLTGDCAQVWYPLSHKILDAINAMTGPTVIDARGCAAGFVLESSAVANFKYDTAIIADKFLVTGGAKYTAPTGVKVWMIMPDTAPDNLPTCAGRSFEISGGTVIDTRIALMMYTPCDAVMGSTNWRGQLFAGEVSLAGSATMGFVPMGLPGYDMSTGTVTSPGTVETPATMFDSPSSQRNIPGDD